MTALDLPADPADIIQRLITAAGQADCVRIAYLAWQRQEAGQMTFTRDDLLTDWLNTWPHHQFPPFRRRPPQRMNIAYPILYATDLFVPVDDDPELREVRWPTVCEFLSNRIGYSIQKEAISTIDMSIEVDADTQAQIAALVDELTNRQTASEMPGELTLTVEAEVIPGGVL